MRHYCISLKKSGLHLPLAEVFKWAVMVDHMPIQHIYIHIYLLNCICVYVYAYIYMM